MAPGLPRIVGGGGSLPPPPCEAKRATAVASCTILPDWPGQPGGLQPGVLGRPGRRYAGSREARGVLLVTSRSRGHTHLPDAPVPASGADGAPPRPAAPIRATRSILRGHRRFGRTAGAAGCGGADGADPAAECPRIGGLPPALQVRSNLTAPVRDV